MSERDFKGVWFPKEVWLDDRLNALEKVILLEIDSLDNSSRGCYASNETLAKFCQCSESKVSAAISKLISLDYIYLQNFDGRIRELRSKLTKHKRQTSIFCEADYEDLEKIRDRDNKLDIKDKHTKGKQGTKKQGVENRGLVFLINDFTENEELRESLNDFVQMRKLIKKPLTEKGLSLLLNKLKSLSKDEKIQIAIVNQSIEHNWQSVYPLKELPREESILDGIL